MAEAREHALALNAKRQIPDFCYRCRILPLHERHQNGSSVPVSNSAHAAKKALSSLSELFWLVFGKIEAAVWNLLAWEQA